MTGEQIFAAVMAKLDLAYVWTRLSPESQARWNALASHSDLVVDAMKRTDDPPTPPTGG